MLNLIKFTLLALLLMTAGCQSQEKTVITKESLAEMFDNISKNTKWDISKPMLWGYFFTDGSREDLQRATPLLEAQGYRLVDIYLGDKDSPQEPDLWWLHVEKIEVHTVTSLYERNNTLYQFADDHDLRSYDGMDVGPPGKAH